VTITGLGPDQTYIDASGLITDRAIQISTSASSVVISGVTIMNGNAANSWGGGIYADGPVVQDINVTLINTVFMENQAMGDGGGLACSDCNLVIQGGEFISNTAGFDGGGMRIVRGSAVLSGVQVITNTATGNMADGGGIALDDTTAAINSSTISRNSSNGTGNGGGGLYVIESTLQLNGSHIISNTSVSRGGGLMIANGQVTLDGGEISHNTAADGGGLTLRYGSSIFTQTGDSLIAYNVAETTSNYQGGGGLFIELGRANLLGGQILRNEGNCGGGLNIFQGSAVLDGGQILSNTAYENGGGVYIGMDSGVLTQTGSSLIAYNVSEGPHEWDDGGGGIFVRYGRAYLNGGQILHNEASSGAGLFLNYGHAVLSGGQILSNTAIVHGGGAFVKWHAATLTQTGSSLLAHNVVSATSESYHGGGGIFIQMGKAALEGGIIEDNDGYRGGGVMLWTSSATVEISGGEISDNSATQGGGIYNTSGQVMFSGGEIVSNVATSGGGGLYLDGGQASLLGGQIRDNRAQNGGGLYSWSAPIVLNGSQILSNTAIDTGGGVYLRYITAFMTQTGDSLIAYNIVTDTGPSDGGGGVFLFQGSLILEDGEIEDNEAQNGGGVMMDRTETRMDMSGGEISDNWAGAGGGVYASAGQVTVSGGRIVTNTGEGSGGGVYLGSDQAYLVHSGGVISDNLAYDGGGVYVDYGAMTLDGGQVVSNVAADEGGGVYVTGGTISVTHSASQINDNRAQDGGGVYSYGGDVIMSAGEIANNIASSGGGGVVVFSSSGALAQSGNSSIAHNQAAYGGGVYLHFGDATLTGGQIYSNTVTNQGGGIYVSQPASQLTTNGGQIIDNRADLKGGGIYVLVGSASLTGTQIVGNSAGNGGGLFVEGSGDAVLYQVSVLSNTASSGAQDGGGISNWGTTTIVQTEIAHNLALNAGWGGGIFNASNLNVFSSTIASNDVSASGAGGGLYNWTAGTAAISRSVMYGNHAGVGGAVYNLNQVQIVNSTLTDNNATGAGVQEGGGALFIDVGGTAVLTHATIVSNTAGYSDGINVFSGTAELRGTVLAYNGTDNCAVAAGSQLTSNGYNLEDSATCGLSSTGDITGTDPLLGALGDNGGPTLTHAPDRSSAVSDAIPAGSCTLSVDQRGLGRPYGDGCDIGAFELQISSVYLPLTLRNY
jgi:hypothetical protein